MPTSHLSPPQGKSELTSLAFERHVYTSMALVGLFFLGSGKQQPSPRPSWQSSETVLPPG